jgi:hypothetical protein
MEAVVCDTIVDATAPPMASTGDGEAPPDRGQPRS